MNKKIKWREKIHLGGKPGDVSERLNFTYTESDPSDVDVLEYEFTINGHIALGIIYIQRKELMSLMTINLLICLKLFV